MGAGYRVLQTGPSDSSSLGLVCLFSGAIALCIRFTGVMEGSPGKANPVRGPRRQAAGLGTGSDRVDQAWDLSQPKGGKKPRGQQGASCPETRTSTLLHLAKTMGCIPKALEDAISGLCWPPSPSLTNNGVLRTYAV